MAPVGDVSCKAISRLQSMFNQKQNYATDVATFKKKANNYFISLKISIDVFCGVLRYIYSSLPHGLYNAGDNVRHH